MAFRILSIDGGGIRGIIPAAILKDLEQRTQRPVCRLFDLVAGTSTGGILALGLTCPNDQADAPRYSAAELLDLYLRDGPTIFHRTVWDRVRSGDGLLEEKYPSDNVEAVLRKQFGDLELKQSLTPTLVTAYEIERRQPYFFKSERALGDPKRNFAIREAARATSAAPTYFEPAKLQVPGEATDYLALVDGGVFANNPAACALVEGIAEFGATIDSVVLLSLGTGELTRPIFYNDAKDWGLAKWAQPVLNVVFDGVSDTVHYQLGSILREREGVTPYLRIQTQLPEKNEPMDDAGEENMRALTLIAQRLIEENDEALSAMADLLIGEEDTRAASAGA